MSDIDLHKLCDCRQWLTKGVVRLGRARYVCSACRGDCSLELLFAVEAGVDVSISQQPTQTK